MRHVELHFDVCVGGAVRLCSSLLHDFLVLSFCFLSSHSYLFPSKPLSRSHGLDILFDLWQAPQLAEGAGCSDSHVGFGFRWKGVSTSMLSVLLGLTAACEDNDSVPVTGKFLDCVRTIQDRRS